MPNQPNSNPSYRNRNRDRSRRFNNSDRVNEKARKLLHAHRTEYLGNGLYNVVGDHGTYTVAIDHTGKISCNCPGYLQKQRCSHAQAITLQTQKHKQKPH